VLLEYCVLEVGAGVIGLPFPNVLAVVAGWCGSRILINGLQLVCGSELIGMTVVYALGISNLLGKTLTQSSGLNPSSITESLGNLRVLTHFACRLCVGLMAHALQTCTL